MTAAKKRASAPKKPVEQIEKNPLVAEAEARAITRPDGLPDLWPLHAMPLRKRATAYRSVASLQESFTKLAGMDIDDNGEVELDLGKVEIMADMLELCADIGDLLILSAAPGREDDMAAWVEDKGSTDAGVQDFTAAFGFYMTTMQPGEAAGS